MAVSNPTPITRARMIVEDVMLLVEQELLLARQEMDLKFQQAYTGIACSVAGVLAAFIGFAVLVQAVIEGLAVQLPDWAAAAIVGAVCVVLAIIFFNMGAKRLKPQNLKPTRTIKSLAETAVNVKEHMK